MENEDYDEDFLIRQGICRLKEMGIALLIAIVICLLFGSCKTIYVPVETTHTIYQNHTDSVHQIDSIFREKETIIRETNSGDSALLAELGIKLEANQKAILILQRELEKERNKEVEHRNDTIIENDTVQVPYPVEKKLSFMRKAEIGSVGFVGGLAVCGAIGIVLWLRRRYKRT